MKIILNKFGTTLTSRQLGNEAYKALLPTLKDVSTKEAVEIDFAGVNTFSPSWGDEFLTPLMKTYSNIKLFNTGNLSVHNTLKMLERINQYQFIIKN
jgi:hypothetical protein